MNKMTKLTQTTWVLAFPLALSVAGSAARAADGLQAPATERATEITTPAKSVTRTTTPAKSGTAPKTTTTTRSGNMVTRQATTTTATGKTATHQAAIVKSGNTVTRDATTVGPNGGTTIAHSIHEWEPGKVTTQTTRTATAPAEKHGRWWHRHHN
jgi:hypothetical protein